ncbi:growth factor receptor-bound protein 7-like isoform X4 [Leucoraja erinacea]|nr:growth factor receptor-bound protein 7-like isoform X4 [Leucoraja erinacea]
MRAICRLREWIKGHPQVLSSDSTAGYQDADMDIVVLERSVSTRLGNLYQKDAESLLPNGHRTASPTDLHPALRTHSSQPLHIPVHRQLKEEEFRTASLPTIPNPFPELCSHPSSPTFSSPHPPSTRDTHVITVFSEDGMRRSLGVRAAVTARDICCQLVDRHRCVDRDTWALVECHPDSALERCLEDHELPVEVQSTWPVNSRNKFIFRKHYAKYEFFRNPQSDGHISPPQTFFPMQMLAGSLEADAGIPQAQLTQNFLNVRSCPEIQGFLHLKEKGKKTWRRLYFFLRRSGFYYSTKGTSKEPRHLQYFADVNESNIYTVTSRKMYNSPTDHGFCVKGVAVTDKRLLCCEDEQSHKCWMTAFRLLKLGPQLCLNYQLSQQKNAQKSWNEPAVGRGPETCLVPMDFSGCTGRVIENPSEASLVAEEEGLAWRQKKGVQRHSLPSLCQDSGLSTAIHKSQPWFHGRISREEAHRLIVQHGHIDGVFLMRESQRTPKSFVLSLSHHHKTKHFLVAPCEEDGQMFFTMDTGQTRFNDLIQLVDFYQINRGALPCSLKHYCTRVSL